MKPIVIIPTYNEIESLPRLVAQLRERKPELDILVVDDHSPDGTGELADRLAADDEHLTVLHRTAKDGLAAAYIAGFKLAIERGFTHLVQMDADGSHRPVDLERLLDRAGGVDRPDLVIGSRWMPGGEVVNWPKKREWLSRLGNLYNRLALGLPQTDITAGFRVYRADKVATLDLDAIKVAGYYWQTDMTERAHRAGWRIVEVPIVFVERELGDSKLSGAIFTESLRETTTRGLRHRASQVRRLLRRS
ncbi:MAG: polyprenol monophosphomannose synthase [Flaviflexus sp.]|nr:polyprenol monophosphomannose synthase [Flaviflexus sp.]